MYEKYLNLQTEQGWHRSTKNTKNGTEHGKRTNEYERIELKTLVLERN